MTNDGERDAQRSETADRILDAVERSLATKGVKATSMVDIARAAGVTRMTVYRYYGSRDELLQAFIQRELSLYYAELFERVREIFARTPEGENPAHDVLCELTEFTVCKFYRKPVIAALVENDPELVLPYVTIRADFLLGGIVSAEREMLDHWKSQGWIAPLPSDWIAEWLGRLAVSWRFQTSPVFDTSDPATVRQLFDAFIWPVLDPERYVPPSD